MRISAWVCLALLAAVDPAAQGAAGNPVILDQKIEGRLGVRWQLNIGYLRQICEDHAAGMLAPFQNREGGYKRIRDWDGEYAGKWLDAAARIPESAAPDLRRKVEEFTAALRATQESDGYFGIDSRDRRGRVPWDVWNQWYVLTGLLTHYEQTGDRASLEAAAKAARWLVRTYGDVTAPNHRFFRAAHRGGCNVDVIDQLARLHALSPDPALVHFVRGVVGNFRDVATMQATGKPVLMHSYVLFAYLGGIVDLSRFGGQPVDLAWLQSVAEDVVRNHLYPTGSAGYKERLSELAPNDEADGKHQETCATVEWILLNERLYAATGDVRYVNRMEDSIYNALLAAQSANGKQWTYFTPLRYKKQFSVGPTSCCYWSGPRGISRLPGRVYSAEPGGLRVDFFESGTATARIGGRVVRLRQRAAFPAEGRTLIEVGAEAPVEFILAIRIPEWARAPAVAVNGKPLRNPDAGGGYVRIRRRWSAADKVSIRFEIAVTMRKLGTHGSAVARGPEVLSIDARDNPGLDLDGVVLPARLALAPAAPSEGRRRYRTTVMVAGAPRRVVFTPYADAGNDGARFRTIFPVPAE